MSEMHFRQPGFACVVLVDHSQKSKQEYQNSKKQETQVYI